MPVQVLMPALSPTMEKGNLSKWLKKEGDAVKSGDVIAEIETDKATMEVEAVDEGTVEALLVAEGTEEVKVNSVIARLKGDGAAAAAPAPAAAPEPAADPNPQPASRAEAKGDPSVAEKLEDELEDAVAFAGVSKYPARIKCALMSWMALKDASVRAVSSAHPAAPAESATEGAQS